MRPPPRPASGGTPNTPSGAAPATSPATAGPSLSLDARELAIIIGVWGFLALVAIASRFLDPRIPGINPQVTAALVRLTLFEYAIWTLLTPPLLWFAARLTAEQQHLAWRILTAILLGLVLAVLTDAAVEAMRSGVLRPSRRRRRDLPPPMFGFRNFRRVGDLGFVDDLMVYFAVLFAGIARALMLRARAREVETTRLQAQTARLQAQLSDARLGALRAQLDPHFLFNTLNAVSAMVGRDPRGVRRMISRLSELLRHSLEDTTDEIPLERELELLDRYLDIMRVRFGERLQVTVDAAPDARAALVPNVLLQPIVENAVKYAVAPSASGGRVRVSARRLGDRLLIQVRDSGPEPGAPPAPAGAGLGLRNVRERLAQLYGAAQHLTLRSADDGAGTTVELSIPYRPAAHEPIA